jgi:hypothetical protein
MTMANNEGRKNQLGVRKAANNSKKGQRCREPAPQQQQRFGTKQGGAVAGGESWQQEPTMAAAIDGWYGAKKNRPKQRIEQAIDTVGAIDER